MTTPPPSAAAGIITGLAKLGLALKSRSWQESGPHGLTPTQAQVLGLIRARAPLRLAQVAQDLQITAATASDAVSALVRKGLVVKGRAPDDARAVALMLTPQGATTADSVAGWPDFLLRSVDALTPAEQEIFLRGLIKMIRQLQIAGDIPLARMCVNCRYFRPHHYSNAAAPHHCALVDAPLTGLSLRLDCPDHEEADPAEQARMWSSFTGGTADGSPRPLSS